MSDEDHARRNAAVVQEEVRALILANDVAGAHQLWAWFFNELSKDYANLSGNDAAYAASEAIVAIVSMLPKSEEYAPSRAFVDSLMSLITELPTGKRTHKLFHWDGIAGTWDKGSVRQQIIVGQSLACLALLEHFNHSGGATVIASALGKAGFTVTAATVRDWKTRKQVQLSCYG